MDARDEPLDGLVGEPTEGAPGAASALLAAIRRGDADAVELRLLLGASPDAVGALGEAPLSAAAARPSGAGLVALLLRAGADPRARTRLGWTALHAAARGGDAEAIDLLLAAGADPDAEATSRGPGLRAADDGTPLHMAMLYRRDPPSDRARVERLLAAGASLEIRDGAGRLAVHVAPYVHSSVDALGALLDARPDQLEARDARGWTALHHAAEKGSLPVLEALLARGADPSAEIPGARTQPIHLAAASGLGVEALLAAGASPRARLKDNRTPLMIAADKKKPAALAALLAVDGKIDARERGGLSALMFAVLRAHDPCALLLLEAGADPDVPVTAARRVAGRDLAVGDTPRGVARGRARAWLDGR